MDMGTEYIAAHLTGGPDRIPSIPPGFVPLTSFMLKIEDDVGMTSMAGPSHSTDPLQTQMDTKCSNINEEEFKKSLSKRPWINYSQIVFTSEEDSGSELIENSAHPISCLTKGVVRGCAECSNCQKIIARWHPKDSCRPILNDAPVFYPNDEEFKDTLKYIKSIQSKAELYGICRIVPPSSWKPPCPLKEKIIWENSKFTTCVQNIDKLQNWCCAQQLSVYREIVRRKKRRLMTTGTDPMIGCAAERSAESEKQDCCSTSDNFGYEPGPSFTLGDFQRYADDFNRQYFSSNDRSSSITMKQDETMSEWKPSVDDIEGEYWRIVEKPSEEIEVLYGTDIETNAFGSGFPKVCSSFLDSGIHDDYLKSGWNLNNISCLPGSLLFFEDRHVPGILEPWLYVGMCFSSYGWHVEDHYFYSINYLHFGAPKMWYGVPGRDALKMEAAMKKHLPCFSDGLPNLLHNFATQLSPSILKSEGVQISRCIQQPGEFVLIFPRAYHSGFDCGFNCSEATNLAPLEWLPHGQHAVEIYHDQGWKTIVSYDKLLLRAAREAVKAQWNISFLRKTSSDSMLWKDACGPDKILLKALKARVNLETTRRKHLCSSSRSRKMDASFDASDRKCFICHYDLHLSAAKCSCSSEKFACLNHAAQICSCDWNKRFFFFRYEISELNILVDALSRKLSSVHKWGTSHLGLSLSPQITNRKSLEQTPDSVSSSACNKEKPSDGAPSDMSASNELNQNEGIESESCFEGAYKNGGGDDMFNVEEGHLRVFSDLLKSTASRPSDEGRLNSTPQKSYLMQSSIGVDKVVVAKPNDPSNLNGTGKTMSVDANFVELFGGSKKCCDTLMDKTEHTNVNCHNGASDNLMEKLSTLKQIGECSSFCKGNSSLNSEMQESAYTSEKNKHETKEVQSVAKPKGTQSVSESSSCPSSTVDRYTQHKGSGLTKSPGRISYNVELLQSGVVLSGKLWCSSKAIFSKGYRSRVKYFSISDPTQLCYYISEILHSECHGPLFMVQVEQCPSDVFIHVTATRCWDMVRERLNHEIRRQHSFGNFNVPPLQPPGSVDGLEMFGFSSPGIIQALEALDHSHICLEYWRSKLQRECTSLLEVSTGDFESELRDECGIMGQYSVPGSDSILQGLFKKANPDELDVLWRMLCSGKRSFIQQIIQLINKEIQRRPNSNVTDGKGQQNVVS